MEYERILVEMLNRIKALEERVDALENTSVEPAVLASASKKYRLLTDYLYQREDNEVRLTFDDIEKILGFKPPPSAYTHRAFWANAKSHPIAQSWMSVGFEAVEVNITERYVIFDRKRDYVDIGRRKTEDILAAIGHLKVSELQGNTPKGGGTRG